MTYLRRVTIRCLCDDLETDWADVAQQRRFMELRSALEPSTQDSKIATILRNLPTTALAAHPLVRGFYSAFEGDGSDIQRESNSGLSSPHWWKQKTSRWRGAATDAECVGQSEVWLCAGGIRIQGDIKTSTSPSHQQ